MDSAFFKLLIALILLVIPARCELFQIPNPEDEVCSNGGSCDISEPSSNHLEAEGEEPTKFENIGYLSVGYDLIKGNPHSTTEFDPGYKSSRLFDLTYNEGNLTPDGKHFIPDHVNAMNQPSCSFTFTSSTATGEDTYSESLSVDASVEGKFWGASFSASVDYKNVQKTTSQYDARFYSTKARCIVYGAGINYDVAELSADFKKTVSQLPFNGTDMSQYEHLITQYGTHFVSSMRMGGRYGYKSLITSTSSMDLTTRGIDVKAAAGYSGLISVNAKVATKQETEHAQEFNSARTSVEEFFVGGGPPSNDSWTPYDWANTVDKNPLPITYTLVNLDKLFTSIRFPNDSVILQKRNLLQRVLIQHCQKISSKPELCEVDYKNSSTLIPIRILNATELDGGPNSFLQRATILPFERAPGQWITNDPSRINSAFVILARDLDKISDLVRPANAFVNCTDTALQLALCPNGFHTISDFFVYVIPENLNEITLPCFASKCLTTCKLHPNSNRQYDLYQYDNGYPQLGGHYTKAGFSFLRTGITNNRPDAGDLEKCLTYDCLDY